MGKVTALRKPARPENAGPLRPFPPAAMPEGGDGFAPAPEVADWVNHHILTPGGALFNADHAHLMDADLAFLWAPSSFAKQGRTVLGQCEQVMFRAGGWQKARQEGQMQRWFGRVPAFLITLAADWCAQAGDTEFCALVEHELYHLAHKHNAETGEPMFDRTTGLPKLCMRGHDVEEFVGVVRRYGPSADVIELLKAAEGAPEVAVANIAHSCGTCLERAA
jgi:hypothetical protein